MSTALHDYVIIVWS